MAEVDDQALLGFLRAIAARDRHEITRLLASTPDLATIPVRTGATRQNPDEFFLTPIRHAVYRGDTALHIAAAAHDRETVASLLALGADVRARNRRGAEPIHYACDGGPDSPGWDPDAQPTVIADLIAAGADPSAPDNDGVSPLHRAVRTRCSGAVTVLVEHGADPRAASKRGSTPLHLAVQNTGRSNSGTDASHAEQARIIALLLQYGARPTDTDAKGKTVADAAGSDWIRALLDAS